MNKTTKNETKAARDLVDELIENHEHNELCMQIETVEITYFVTPDIDQSYEREIYVCKITDEQIEDVFPELDRLMDE